LLARLFRRLFLEYLEIALRRRQTELLGALAPLPSRRVFLRYPSPRENPNGSSTPNHPLPDPNRC
jgi:hypothetical protein